MSILSKTIQLFNKKRPLYHYSVEFELAYTEKLSRTYDLKNDIHRAFCQYKCFKKINNPFKQSVLSVAYAFYIPLYTLYLLLIGLFFKKSPRRMSTNRKLAINITYDTGMMRDVSNEFEIIETSRSTGYLRREDLIFFFRKMGRFWFSPYFLIKGLSTISQARKLADNYKPDAIINNREFWFDCSILTCFCEAHGIEHINIMHGEKLLWFRDSFFRFHRFYVWDDEYAETMKLMKADPGQFISRLPIAMEGFQDIPIAQADPKKMKYYLQGGESIKTLNAIYSKLSGLGYSVEFRPHPRYTKNIPALISAGLTIEKNSVPIEDSIRETSFVISKYSTVLFQAFLSKRQCIIDDYSNPELYQNLVKRRFIAISKAHDLLSGLMPHDQN